MTTIPFVTPDELKALKGGELVVRYIECVRRYERMPDARWLRRRLDVYGDELYLRMKLGTLSEALCGLLSHHYPGPWGSPTCCNCAS